MQCGRCGAVFAGNFCPQCGAPATAPAEGALQQCPRCGTYFQGRFCPNCGLPVAYPLWRQVVPQRPYTGRVALTVLWTIAMVLFVVIAVLAFAALGLASGLVVPNILGIQSGSTVNAGLDSGPVDWAFTPLDASASGTYRSSSGNPGGYLEASSSGFGGNRTIGRWSQAFYTAGSEPYVARAEFDVEARLGDTANTVTVYALVDASPLDPSPNLRDAVGVASFSSTTGWTDAGRFDATGQVTGSGTYYLSLVIVLDASGPGSSTTIGLDNIRMSWATDAAVVIYFPAPFPSIVYVSQEIPLFLTSWGFLLVVLFCSAAYFLATEWRSMAAPFQAPVEAIGYRLRNRSAWLTIGQVWLAITFFQVAYLLVAEAIGVPATSPIEPTPQNAWVLLYELANAAVYEEIVFRVVLIGLPLMVASFALRVMELNRGGFRGRGPPWKHLAGSLRYLLGGNVRRSSTRETLLAAMACLVVSASFFGLAHLPGWGWWKVLPSLVAGLGFGYLFLRHGVAASMLAHLVNNYIGAWLFLDVGGSAIDALVELLFLAAVLAGAGFFAWYILRAGQHLREMRSWFAGPRRVVAASPATGMAAMPMPPAPFVADPSRSLAQVQEARALVRSDPALIPRDYRPTYRPPPYGYPPVRFQCPSCGWVEARYDDGRFSCVRCGRTS